MNLWNAFRRSLAHGGDRPARGHDLRRDDQQERMRAGEQHAGADQQLLLCQTVGRPAGKPVAE